MRRESLGADADEGVGEEQDEAHDQSVNGQGFDEGEGQNHGTGHLAAHVGVAGDAFAGALQTETHADTAAESGDADAQGGGKARRVAVGGGACGSGMMDALAAGCATFVTSDLKYNDFWDARDLGLNLIDAGHFYTENPVCVYLAERVQAQFPDVFVKISLTI